MLASRFVLRSRPAACLTAPARACCHIRCRPRRRSVDRLTIAPNLLAELKASDEEVSTKLSFAAAKQSPADLERVVLTEPQYRFLMACNPMATEKLAEGVRKFAEDLVKLEDILKKHL